MLTRWCLVSAFCLVLATGSLNVLHPEGNPEKLKIGDPLPDFVLDDAYGIRYELKEMWGKYVFLLFGNRRLREENRLWASSLKNAHGARHDVRIFMIADMQGIPFFRTDRSRSRQAGGVGLATRGIPRIRSSGEHDAEEEDDVVAVPERLLEAANAIAPATATHAAAISWSAPGSRARPSARPRARACYCKSTARATSA